MNAHDGPAARLKAVPSAQRRPGAHTTPGTSPAGAWPPPGTSYRAGTICYRTFKYLKAFSASTPEPDLHIAKTPLWPVG